MQKRHHWNDKIVMAYIEDAASIHRRLPDVKVQGYYTLWPETLKDDWHRLYDAIHGKSKLGSPMAWEVTYHETIMEWLRWLDPYHQKVVWMRANRIPWKVLINELGKSRPTLWRDMNYGLTVIAAELNAKETAVKIKSEKCLSHVLTH